MPKLNKPVFKKRKSIIDLLTGGQPLPEIDTNVTFDKETKEVLIGTALILGISAIITGIILSRK